MPSNDFATSMQPSSGAPLISLHISRRAAIRLGLAGVLGTALAACSSKSSQTNAAGSKAASPLNAAKLASFIIGSWDLTITRDFHDGNGPSAPYTGTLNVHPDGWDIQLGKGATTDPDQMPPPGDGDGNAKGTWQTASNSLAITPSYGAGAQFGDKGASWWSTLTASGLSGSPHTGQQFSLPWNPTLSGNDADMFANPGTLAVHIKTSRSVTITHTMNPPSDPQTVELDKTTTTITATKR